MLVPYTPNPGIGAADPALPDGPPANLACVRELLDNRRYLRGSTWGLLTWSGLFEVGGSAATPDVTLGEIESCVLRRASGKVVAFYAAAVTTSGIAWSSAAAYVAGDHVVSGGTVWRALGSIAAGGAAPSAGPDWSADLAPDDWYYVYAVSTGTDAAPGMAYELSQTGPTTSGTFKADGAPTELKRYLGCFPTDSTGKPVPVLAVRGQYRYRRSAITSVTGAFAANGLRAVPAGGGAVARTGLNLAARVPPHARRAVLFGQAVVTSTAAGASTALNLYDESDTASVSEEIIANVANNTETSRNSARAEVQLTSAQVCGYAVVGSGGLYDATIDLMGWEE
ncbi:MAG: hypothetical protein Q8S73_26645 [Deltaproteobacteria bacterium]|nr:hypothetical protein [Myxococcales bacterium]MDP3217715.1 hypothetical protein [Deltaproteobacteria bacterium]